MDFLRALGSRVAPLADGRSDDWAAGSVMAAAMMGWALLEDWFHESNPSADVSTSREYLVELLDRMAEG